MTLSVRIDPGLEARVEQEARRRGITKSELVTDALERILGLKSPADLLAEVRSGTPMGRPGASTDVAGQMRSKLHAKRSR